MQEDNPLERAKILYMCVCAKNAASTRILQNTVVVEEAIVKRDPHKNHHHHHKKYVVTILFKPYNVVTTVFSFNKKLVLEVYSVHNNNPSHLIFWKHAEYKKSQKVAASFQKTTTTFALLSVLSNFLSIV